MKKYQKLRAGAHAGNHGTSGIRVLKAQQASINPFSETNCIPRHSARTRHTCATYMPVRFESGDLVDKSPNLGNRLVYSGSRSHSKLLLVMFMA